MKVPEFMEKKTYSSTRPASSAPYSDRYSGGGGYGGGYQGGYQGGDSGGFDGGYEYGTEGRRRYTQLADRNRCRFCREKITRVDYKDVLTLQKMCTNQGRIFSRKRSGNCAACQRMMKKAIKQARYMGLLTYTA
jgi:small subunit ribosomal protein S18